MSDSNFMSLAVAFSWNQISTGNLVTKSMTTPIFPANWFFGTSARLSNFLKTASNVEPSLAQILANLVWANWILSGSGLLLRLCHFCSNSGNNSLNTRSNISAGNVRNLCDNACWLLDGSPAQLTCVGWHHRNPSLASILLSSLTRLYVSPN